MTARLILVAHDPTARILSDDEVLSVIHPMLEGSGIKHTYTAIRKSDAGVGFTPRLASNGDRFAEDLSPRTDVSPLVESVSKALNDAQKSDSDEPFCVVVSGLVNPDEVVCLEDICQTSLFANGTQIPDGTVMVAQKATPVGRVEI